MNKYQEFIINSVPQEPFTPEFAQHAAIGLVTEAGELLQCYRKRYFQGKEVTKDQVISELGDVYFYFQMMLISQGITETELVEQNMRKLLARRASK